MISLAHELFMSEHYPRNLKSDILQEEEITTELLYNSANYLPFLEVFIGLTTKQSSINS